MFAGIIQKISESEYKEVIIGGMGALVVIAVFWFLVIRGMKKV